MATRYSPAIVTSGLVLCLDAANPKSYSGTGTTWTDLSGNGYNGTLVNSPTFSQGVFTFNGSTNYINVSGVNFATGTSTIMGAARYTGATRGRIININKIIKIKVLIPSGTPGLAGIILLIIYGLKC